MSTFQSNPAETVVACRLENGAGFVWLWEHDHTVSVDARPEPDGTYIGLLERRVRPAPLIVTATTRGEARGFYVSDLDAYFRGRGDAIQAPPELPGQTRLELP